MAIANVSATANRQREGESPGHAVGDSAGLRRTHGMSHTLRRPVRPGAQRPDMMRVLFL
jgi:hypothetical protein